MKLWPEASKHLVATFGLVGALLAPSSESLAGSAVPGGARTQTTGGPVLVQARSGNFARSYIEANGGCAVWQRILRAADWTRDVPPFGKPKSEWTEADFVTLERALADCIDLVERRGPEWAAGLKQDVRDRLEYQKGVLVQVMEQEQRRRSEQLNAERRREEERAAAEARRQAAMRADEARQQAAVKEQEQRRLQEAAQRDEQARQDDARQEAAIRDEEQRRLQEIARREEQARRDQNLRRQQEQARARVLLEEETRRAEAEERYAANTKAFSEKVARARSNNLRQVRAMGIPASFLAAPIVFSPSALAGMGEEGTILKGMTLENAIALLIESRAFQAVTPVRGTHTATQQEVYGFSVKRANERSQSFGFVLDGPELYCTFFGVGDNPREIPEDRRPTLEASLGTLIWDAAAR